MADDAMATAAYAILDPETGAVQYASAAHLPPILISGGTARSIETEPAPPLGSFPYGSCTEQQLQLASGETMVFYTDGLVERPGIGLDQSIQALAEILATTTSAASACRTAVEQFVPPEGLRDDVAIIAVENGEIPDQLRLRLDANANVLSRMRRDLRRWLRKHGADDTEVAEITIAVSEACANAIEHAYSPSPARFNLEASVVDSVVTIAVIDQGHWRAPRGESRGRGLTIVDAAMDNVEIITDDRGTVVWMWRKIGTE